MSMDHDTGSLRKPLPEGFSHTIEGVTTTHAAGCLCGLCGEVAAIEADRLRREEREHRDSDHLAAMAGAARNDTVERAVSVARDLGFMANAPEAPTGPRESRVPLTGLRALAWNTHHVAAALERHQANAIDEEAERLMREGERLHREAEGLRGSTEARRVATLRAIVADSSGVAFPEGWEVRVEQPDGEGPIEVVAFDPADVGA